MANCFVRPVTGSDANTGLTAGSAFKTSAPITQAFVNANSITRVKLEESLGPFLVGSAAWTNLSATVTIPAGKIIDIETCDNVWTAATNVTAIVDSTASNYRQGTGSARFTVAAAFTTGKIAFKALSGTLDLSTMQQVSFFIKTSIVVASGVLQIKLCSDVSGNTPVNTLTINEAHKSTFKAIDLDNGGALGSNINSIAIYAVSDPGSVIINLDNVIACKASASADAITLRSRIGKNTSGETWYSIQSLSGTTLIIGGTITLTSGSVNLRGYYGTTETADLYRIKTFFVTDNLSQTVSGSFTLAFSGTSSVPIEISGGWNTSDMTVQSGVTWFDEWSNSNIGMKATGQSWLNFNTLGFAHFYNGLELANCSNCNIASSVHSNDAFAWGIICSGTTDKITIGAVRTFLSGNYGLTPGANCIVGSLGDPVVCYGNAVIGFYANSGGDNIVYVKSVNNRVNVDDYYFSGNKYYSPITSNFYGTSGWQKDFGRSFIFNASISDSIEFLSGVNFGNAKLYSHDHDQTVGNVMIFTDGGTIQTDLVTREKTSGPSWRFDVTSANRDSTYPLPLGGTGEHASFKTYCRANKLMTVSARVRRSNTGITFRMVVPGGQLSGVPSDVVATASAAQDTWETITLTFTPTAAGVVDVVFQAYGGTTYSAWLDKFPVFLQAA